MTPAQQPGLASSTRPSQRRPGSPVSEPLPSPPQAYQPPSTSLHLVTHNVPTSPYPPLPPEPPYRRRPLAPGERPPRARTELHREYGSIVRRMVQLYETLSDENDNHDAVGKFLAEVPPKDLAKTAALGIGYPPGELKDWLETAFTTISNTLRHEEHLRITALSNRINNENGPVLNPAERAVAQELRYDKFFRPAAVTMVSEAAKARLHCTGRCRKWDAKAAVLEDLGEDSLEDATMQRRTAELRLYCSRKSRGWSAKAAFLDDLGEKLALSVQNKDNDETWFPESDEDCVYVTPQEHIQQAFSKYIQEGEAFLDNLDRPWTKQPDERDFNEPAGEKDGEAMNGGDNETDHENDDDSDAEDENDPGAEEENEAAADPNVELDAEHESDDHDNARMMSNHNGGAYRSGGNNAPNEDFSHDFRNESWIHDNRVGSTGNVSKKRKAFTFDEGDRGTARSAVFQAGGRARDTKINPVAHVSAPRRSLFADTARQRDKDVFEFNRPLQHAFNLSLGLPSSFSQRRNNGRPSAEKQEAPRVATQPEGRKRVRRSLTASTPETRGTGGQVKQEQIKQEYTRDETENETSLFVPW